MREAKLESLLHRLTEQHEKALTTERLLQQEILRLSTEVASLEVRCDHQDAELAELRLLAKQVRGDQEKDSLTD